MSEVEDSTLIEQSIDAQGTSQEEENSAQKKLNFSDWKNDPRVAFDQVANKWIFEDPENGDEFEYDEIRKIWIPVIDEEEIENQQNAYKQASEEHPVTKQLIPESNQHLESDTKLDELEALDSKYTKGQKRKSTLSDEDTNTKKSSNSKNSKQKTHVPPPNRGIYITKLPLDTTVEELDQVFSKYGMISQDISDQSKRIKIYKDHETGKPKGDALIIYFKPESVQLAVEMMDEAELRVGDKTSVIHVEPAQFDPTAAKNKQQSYKKNASEASSKDGEPVEETAEEERQRLKKKAKIKKQYEKMNEKLADWDEDEDDDRFDELNPALRLERRQDSIPKRWDKFVILKNVFTLEELEEDPEALGEIEQDMWAGAEEIGPVTKVVLFDGEPEGVVSIKFKNKQDVIKCILKMNGRFYTGRKLEADFYDGTKRYKTKEDLKKQQNVDGDDDEEQKRIEEFGNWLEREE